MFWDEKSTAKSEASKAKEESTKPEPVKSNHYNDVNVIWFFFYILEEEPKPEETKELTGSRIEEGPGSRSSTGTGSTTGSEIKSGVGSKAIPVPQPGNLTIFNK